MKKVAIVFAGLAGITLASCGPQVTQAGIGYGLTHDHYVGVVELVTVNDKITEISFEEYFCLTTGQKYPRQMLPLMPMILLLPWEVAVPVIMRNTFKLAINF